jgi:hypothetical protein
MDSADKAKPFGRRRVKMEKKKKSKARVRKPSGVSAARKGKVEKALVKPKDALLQRKQALEGVLSMGIGERSWCMRRYFGPFWYKEFEEIQVVLDREGARWYHNSYFEQLSQPDRNRYAAYYRPSLQHLEPTPPQTYEAGRVPLNDGVNKILMQLHRISYSSLYGGSIRLEFKMVGDFEYELRKKDTLWDFQDLEMSVYVVPYAYQLNPMNPPSFPRLYRLYVEFVPDGVVEYRITGSQPERRDVSASNLANALNGLTSHLVTSNEADYFRQDVASFVYGFIHCFWWDLFESTKIRADRIVISDNFCDLFTDAGKPFFRIYVKIGWIYMYSKELFSDHEEIRIEVETQHEYEEGPPVEGPGHTFTRQVALHEMSGPSHWLHVGTFPLNPDSPKFKLKRIEFKTRVMQEDLIWDDHYATHVNYIYPAYLTLQERWDSKNFSPFEPAFGAKSLEFNTGGYSYRTQMVVFPR